MSGEGGTRNILGGQWEPAGPGIYALRRDQLPIIPIADLRGEPPEREYAWGTLLQLGLVTMLTGKGGIGKSLLAQNLCASVALGIPFLGLETARMKCLYSTCEDDRAELHRRLFGFAASRGVAIDQLDGWLFLVSLCGEVDTALATFDQRGGTMEKTARWNQLEATVEATGVRLVVLDNATDFMAGDLNDIHQVAEFVNLLTSLAIKMNGAVVILHHPNKAGEEWLGSVAWHNKVRARLIVEEGGIEGDPDARVLRNPKANQGQAGGRVPFRWYRGTFVTDEEVPDSYRNQLSESAEAASDNATFLRCLAERTRQRRAVSERRSATFAPTVFAAMPESKGIGKARLERAMERLFKLGRIERSELWKGEDRKPVYGLREVAGDGAGDGAAHTMRATRETASKAAESRAGDAGNTHTPPKGGEGAAPLGPGAPSWPDGYDDDDWLEYDDGEPD